MNVELSPCPFCKECEPESLVIHQRVSAPVIIAHVECCNCGARGPKHYEGNGPENAEAGAIYVWNARAAPKVKELVWHKVGGASCERLAQNHIGVWSVYRNEAGCERRVLACFEGVEE